jgi:sugar lactone lactonase YvrE
LEPVVPAAGFVEVAVWGEAGGDVSFRNPNAIAIDSQDNVYITEFGGDRVQKFTPDGVLLLQWGGSGGDDGQLRRPTGIAIDRLDRVYVAESGNSRVQKFSSDGEWLATFGGNGRGLGEFLSAMVVIVDTQDRVYVSDWGNHRVQVFDAEGEYQATLGYPEDSAAQELNPGGAGTGRRGDGQLFNPTGVGIDGQGNVFVVDRGNHRVQVFSPDGILSRAE